MGAQVGLQTEWSRLIVGTLHAAGVTDVVVSPGSRSTALVCAALSQEGLRIHSIVDERSAAFFALGRSKATGRPTALLCTSGTAGSHYYPAVIEARMSYVPLVVLTADRPPSLVGCGANQTIDQRGLFGRHVVASYELDLPGASALRPLRQLVLRAVARSRGPTPGPVHINVPAAKPLEPTEASPSIRATVDDLLAASPTRRTAARATPDDGTLAEIASACRDARRGLIVCGPGPVDNVALRTPLFELARASGFAVYAEATSQLRFCKPRPDGVDVVRRLEAMATLPDLILQVGATPISARWPQLDEVRRFVITRHGWPDPLHTAEAVVEAEPADALWALTARLAGHRPRRWRSGASRAQDVTDVEGRMVAALVSCLPAGGHLMVGNSLPVRHLDRVTAPFAKDLRVLHQRGASGIDGLVSGAAGAASALCEPVTLLLGDVSFAHDVGGLAAARQVAEAVPIVVLDNDGGRIFDRLPIADVELSAHQRELWTTPPKLHLEHAAAAYGLPYERVDTAEALTEAHHAAMRRAGPTLIHACVSTPQANHGGRQ